jgi:hypothetical protein
MESKGSESISRKSYVVADGSLQWQEAAYSFSTSNLCVEWLVLVEIRKVGRRNYFPRVLIRMCCVAFRCGAMIADTKPLTQSCWLWRDEKERRREAVAGEQDDKFGRRKAISAFVISKQYRCWFQKPMLKGKRKRKRKRDRRWNRLLVLQLRLVCSASLVVRIVTEPPATGNK